MTKENKTTGLIVLLFALAHAAVAFTFGEFGLSDELLLTLLTMALTVVLCWRRELRLEVTAACIILVNVAGFLIGTEGGLLLGRFLGAGVAASSLATFITTLILGWGTNAVAGALVHGNSHLQSRGDRKEQVRILVFAVAFIFILRLVIFAFSSAGRSAWTTLEVLGMILSNSAVLVALICLNIIFIRFSKTLREQFGRNVWIFLFILFILITSQLTAYIVCFSPESEIRPELTTEFLQLCVVCLICEISAYCIIFIANYSLEVQQAMKAEKQKRHYAQFRYESLKQQVNPHFLFNSLNVLDGLVVDGQNEAASEFIHRLAGLYRYILHSEEERTVTLEREMEFVRSYLALMRTRFPEGFEVRESITEGDLEKKVPPCAVQMLVENAFKHNAVSAERPLKISIGSDGATVEVRNSLSPRKSAASSTGVGQKYIRQQYSDLGGGEIGIEKTESEYIVRLPLLQKSDTCKIKGYESTHR